MSWRPALLLLAALVTVSSAALAGPRVAITVSQDAALAARLRDELDSAGYATVPLPPGDDASPVELILDEDVSIVLLARPHPGGYELWLRERATNETIIREVVSTSDVSAVALRAVELVRVAVLEQGQPRPAPERVPPPVVPDPEPPPPPTPPPPEVFPASPPPAEPAPAILPDPPSYPVEPEHTRPPALGSVELSAIWFHDVGSGDSSAGLEASGGVFHPRRVQTRVSARYLVYMPSLGVGDAGAIDTRLVQGGVSVALHSTDPASDISPFLEVGADFLWLHATGNPSNPTLLGLRKNSFTAYPHIGPGITIGGASFPLRMRAQLAMGVALPQQKLSILGDARIWAWPTLDGTLGIQYLIP